MWFDINTIMVPPRKPKQSLCAGTRAGDTVTATQGNNLWLLDINCVVMD